MTPGNRKKYTFLCSWKKFSHSNIGVKFWYVILGIGIRRFAVKNLLLQLFWGYPKNDHKMTGLFSTKSDVHGAPMSIVARSPLRNHYLVRHVRTLWWSRMYTIYPHRYSIMLTYVRNHDIIRTRSWSCTYAIMISYVRDHDPVRTQYISYIRNQDPVHTQSRSRTYAIMISYVRNYDLVGLCISNCFIWLTYYAIRPYISRASVWLSSCLELREANKGKGGGALNILFLWN